VDDRAEADGILDGGLRSLGQADPLVETLLRRRPDTKSLLGAYIEEIERFNPAYGLVSVRDRKELVIRHILDSLAPLGIIARLCAERNGISAGADSESDNIHSCSIADAGSGAGLPGIPLAVVLREASFTLIERMGRRAGFLRGALAVLGLANVTVREEDLERAARRTPACFNLVVFRAFRPLEGPVLKGLFALLEPGGSLAAWKGRRDRITAEMAAAEKDGVGPGAWEARPLRVPFLDEERHLVTVRREIG
jgi:16S rRNA (guanine527-N7)-methyltransferase